MNNYKTVQLTNRVYILKSFTGLPPGDICIKRFALSLTLGRQFALAIVRGKFFFLGSLIFVRKVRSLPYGLTHKFWTSLKTLANAMHTYLSATSSREKGFQCRHSFCKLYCFTPMEK